MKPMLLQGTNPTSISRIGRIWAYMSFIAVLGAVVAGGYMFVIITDNTLPHIYTGTGTTFTILSAGFALGLLSIGSFYIISSFTAHEIKCNYFLYGEVDKYYFRIFCVAVCPFIISCGLLVAVVINYNYIGDWPAIIATGTIFAFVVCVTKCIMAIFLLTSPQRSHSDPAFIDAIEHVAGSKLTSIDMAQKIEAKYIAPDDPGITWGPVRIGSQFGPQHILVTGKTGAGKSTQLRLFYQQVLPLIGTNIPGGHRAVIYDASGDILQVLIGIKNKRPLNCPIYLMNPLDGRKPDSKRRIIPVAWNIAKDCGNEEDMQELAEILCPVPKDGKKFFELSAANILAAIMGGMKKVWGENWTLLDLLRATLNDEDIKFFLNQSVLGESMCERCFGSTSRGTERADDVLSTLFTSLKIYFPIAIRWSKYEHSLSMMEWMNQESILVIGHSETNSVSVDAINRALFTRLCQVACDSKLPDIGYEWNTRRTWIFLDEVQRIKSLEKLQMLLTTGRKKGVSCVLGFGDISAMHHAYDEKVAESLLEHCNTTAFFAAGPKTAEWQAQVIGRTLQTEGLVGHSISYGVNGTSTISLNRSRQERFTYFPSEFQNMQSADAINGMTGIYITPKAKAIALHHIPAQDLYEGQFKLLWDKATDEEVPRFVECNDDNELTKWSDEERISRGLPVSKQQRSRLPHPTGKRNVPHIDSAFSASMTNDTRRLEASSSPSSITEGTEIAVYVQPPSGHQNSTHMEKEDKTRLGIDQNLPQENANVEPQEAAHSETTGPNNTDDVSTEASAKHAIFSIEGFIPGKGPLGDRKSST